MKITLERKTLNKLLSIAMPALEFYADPQSYHAAAFMFDRPAGRFERDFGKEHGDDFYNRPMPGKTARRAIRRMQREIERVVAAAERDASAIEAAKPARPLAGSTPGESALESTDDR